MNSPGAPAHLRTLRPINGVDRVQVPGDPEARHREERLRLGIPLDEETIVQLRELGEEFGVPLPAPV